MTGAVWYRVKHFGPYNVMQGAGTRGGDWVVMYQGRIIWTCDNQTDAETFARRAYDGGLS